MNPGIENALAGDQGAFENHNPAGLQTNHTTDRLLSRLENVRACGKGYRADCPTGHKSKGTLSIASADDGRILLTCFAMCSALEIVHGIGLELVDLFPARITTDMTLAERRQLRIAAKQSQWQAALGVLEIEARILQVAGTQIKSGLFLNDEDSARLALSIERIESARRVLNGSP